MIFKYHKCHPVNELKLCGFSRVFENILKSQYAIVKGVCGDFAIASDGD